MEKSLEAIEVPVSMKQRMLAAQAECRDEAIDGLAHSVPAAPEGAIVARRLPRQQGATRFEHLSLRQGSFYVFRDQVITDPLQPLAEDDIGEPEALAIELSVQPIR